MIKAELTAPISLPIICHHALVNDIKTKRHCYDVGYRYYLFVRAWSGFIGLENTARRMVAVD